MIQYAHPEAFYLLIGLIPLALLFFLFMRGRKKALSAMGKDSLVARLSPNSPKAKHQWKFAMVALAYSLLVIALANPQIGEAKEKVKRSGVDLMIALDISRSMLAQDEQPNRLLRARQFVSNLIDRLGGDRVGLVLFAGNAYLQVPVTTDYLATKTILRTVSTDLAGTQGTAIGEAIQLTNDAFERGKHEKRVLLIISDGEDHEGESLEIAKKAAEAGLAIYTMGIGSPKGAPIPEYSGNRQVGYKQDKNGSIVLSKLNVSMLKQVAESGGGKYLNLNVDDFLGELAQMEKEEFEEHVFTDFQDQFQWALGLALLFLVLEYFISESKSAWLTDWNIFKS
ncbi:MAG: VWA domain-containing protein [Bacteroidia bacterium]|nr:VWA domain-containing protein [Bacteroidia bacterium]